ncbi:helix-turn-helix domain-containing protein [Clostridium sp. LBM24168]
MKFLTSNEKIKKLRKDLNMKQQDLQDENITRGLISMIEIGRRNLKYDTAVILAKKFNARAKELGHELSIDGDYLLRSPEEDARLYCLKRLRQKNISMDDVKYVMSISERYNLTDVEAEAYCKYGDIYYEKKDCEKAFVNYNQSLDTYKNIKQNEKVSYIYWRLGLCKGNLLQYSDCITYLNFSIHYSLAYDNMKIYELALYDMALAYRKLNKIDLCLENIDKYLSIHNKQDNFTFYIYANILKADCFEIKNDLKTAIDIYISLEDKIVDLENPLLGYIYNNLGLVYCHMNDFKNSINYFNKAETFKYKFDRPTLSHTFIEKSYIFIKQKSYDKAVESIKIGLKNAEEYGDMEYIIKGNLMLSRIYDILNDYDKLEKVYLKLVEILKKTGEIHNIVDLSLVYNKLSLIYLTKGDKTNTRKYLLLSQDTIKSYNNSTYYNIDIF